MITEQTHFKTDLKTLIMIVVGISIAVWTYAEVNSRIVHLEMSKALMEQDLLEASTQKPIDQEQFMLIEDLYKTCLLYTSPSPRDGLLSRMPSSA